MHFVLLRLVNLDYYKLTALMYNVGLFVKRREMVKWFGMARTRIANDLYKNPPIEEAVAVKLIDRLRTQVELILFAAGMQIEDLSSLEQPAEASDGTRS